MRKKITKNIPGFPLSNLNTKVRPQDDFFEYSCGGWMKNNPIPASKPGWGTFYKLRDEGSVKIRSLIKEISSKKNLKKGTEAQLVRDFYKSGIDTKTRNKLGITPIQASLDKVKKIENKKDLLALITELHKSGFSVLWGTGVDQDFKNSDKNIVFIGQSGFTLPDRDFYVKKDKQSLSILKAYEIHVRNIFLLGGFKKELSKKMAKDLVRLEKKLAQVSMDKVVQRDIDKIYNKKTIPALLRETTQIEWKGYFKKIGLKNAKEVVVLNPDYMKNASKLLDTQSLESWKTYLYWNILHDASSYLTTAFKKENFEFFGRKILGNKEMEVEWKRVISLLDGALGEALGKEYSKKYFTKTAQKEMDKLVDNLFVAYEKRIKALDWMSSTTKAKAIKKLKNISRKIGCPKKWKSYKGLVIKPDTYFENILRSSLYEQKREFKRLGNKVDRSEWHMPPQTVNAYYNPSSNEIIFPAGILQPPFFHETADAGINYGAIGSVIGHEMTHGFDDQGARFDGKGDLKNWWKKEDMAAFTRKTKVLIKQYSAYKVGDVNVNGELTLGENIADLGGVVIAYDAYMEHLKTEKRKDIAGFTPEQRFFLGLAAMEASHYRPEFARTRVLTDPHSPARFRVNGPYPNVDEFYEAFGVTKTDKLYLEPKKRTKIW